MNLTTVSVAFINSLLLLCIYLVHTIPRDCLYVLYSLYVCLVAEIGAKIMEKEITGQRIDKVNLNTIDVEMTE